MTKRIQLRQDMYMLLDGQGQIVLSGSVIDVPDNFLISAAQATQLSPGEAAGTLASHGKPTRVRGIRTR